MPVVDPDPSAAARLLVVDDNEDNRYTLIMRLEIEGYSNVVAADDGETALELLRTQDFDLILLDVMMPKVDGYRVLEQLRSWGRLHNIPVIMISALNETASVVRCIELGAVDYLSKPFDPVLLRARVGASLEKKRLRDQVRAHVARMAEELEAARQLQLGMVPSHFPAPTGEWPIEIFAMMEPAREVGGDLYDFYETEDGRLCFLVGDVAGKGVASALFMARTTNLIRLVTRLLRSADGGPPTPADIATAVNGELCRDNAAMMFVSLFLAVLDPRTGDLQFTNAGHNSPYHIDARGVTAIADFRSRPLGVRHDTAYRTGTMHLAPGAALCLFTDGITEAANHANELFGEARLEAVLRTVGDDPRQLIESVTHAVQSHANGAPQSDDITLLALRRLASA